jgi:uncharacterized protein
MTEPGLRERMRREDRPGEDDVAAIVRREAEERLAAAASYDGVGHDDRAERLRAEADALAAFLDD